MFLCFSYFPLILGYLRLKSYDLTVLYKYVYYSYSYIIFLFHFIITTFTCEAMQHLFA